MGNFDAQLERMKALYTYGMVNEDKKQSNYTLEFHRTAADGKEYGIVRECNHFYIKSTTPEKATIAEAYNYIGGFNNKKDYQYDSYSNALKNFELKLESINEAHDAKVDVTTLDPFKKNEVLAEGTDKMRDEIARQRQIMYNASMIMNESKDYAVKGGPACSTDQPEAETGKKGDEGYTKATADPEFSKETKGLETKQEPFTKKVNEEVASPTEGDFDEGAKPFGTTQNGEADTDHNNDPFTETVNEETDDWASEGLPSSAGVGEADTDHNNGPFNNTVNEGDEIDDDILLDDDDDVDGAGDVEGDIDGEDDFDFGGEEGAEGEEFPEVGDGEDLSGEDFAGEDDVDVEGGEGEEEDVMARIARLEAELAELKAEYGGEEDVDGEVEGEAEPIDGVEGDDLGAEGEEDFGAEGEDDFGAEGEGEEAPVEDDYFKGMEESKKAKMNQIIESVVKQFINEDELHDFGKHPGYRKKPMELPTTGEDKNEHGEDINDESVHNEEPFGKQIGDGDPFNQLVKAVTDDVMYQLKKGIPIEGENKKKAE